MIFYSLAGGTDGADSGLPSNPSIGATEDANGNFTFIVGNIYHGISPEGQVPEPVTLSLFGAGLVGAFAARRRRKQTA